MEIALVMMLNMLRLRNYIEIIAFCDRNNNFSTLIENGYHLKDVATFMNNCN